MYIRDDRRLIISLGPRLWPITFWRNCVIRLQLHFQLQWSDYFNYIWFDYTCWLLALQFYWDALVSNTVKFLRKCGPKLSWGTKIEAQRFQRVEGKRPGNVLETLGKHPGKFLSFKFCTSFKCLAFQLAKPRFWVRPFLQKRT